MTAAWGISARRPIPITMSAATGSDVNPPPVIRPAAGFFQKSCRLAAELHQIAGDMLVGIAAAQRGGELRHAIGKQHDAADLAEVPLAAMLEGGGHPVGITTRLHRA